MPYSSSYNIRSYYEAININYVTLCTDICYDLWALCKIFNIYENNIDQIELYIFDINIYYIIEFYKNNKGLYIYIYV